MDPRPYEHVDTDDLIGELIARSRCIFVVLRPLAVDPNYGWRHTASVDGKQAADSSISADDADRIIGLAMRGIDAVRECTSGGVVED